MGSGTLADDVVPGQLSLGKRPGLVLSNGEFGERLIDHAKRFDLKLPGPRVPLGPAPDPAHCARVGQKPSPAWVWCAHCETSTGVLNDLAMLRSLCGEFQARLCLDAISSIGTLPVDLRGVYLATSASGKGLRAYPGISMVFYHDEVAPAPQALPRYLDLGYYAANQGVPFTFSSNLLHALHAALRRVHWDQRFAELLERSAWLRARLSELGFDLVGCDAPTSPAVLTIALPLQLNSVKIGGLMRESGYLLNCNSDYLQRRNWIQISLMGECAMEKLVSLLNALNRVCSRRRAILPECHTSGHARRSS